MSRDSGLLIQTEGYVEGREVSGVMGGHVHPGKAS